MKYLSFACVVIALSLTGCGEGTKSGVTTSGDGMVNVTDLSVCGPAIPNATPLAGTSWSETLRGDKVQLKRSFSFTGDTITARVKATDLVTNKSESIRSVVRPHGDAFSASEFSTERKELKLQDGTPYRFGFDDKAGTITFRRVGNCLQITNGRETGTLVPEL